MSQTISHVVGLDDAPFPPHHRGDVLVVGAVYAGTALHGVLSAKVRRDGANATRVLAHLIANSRFAPQLQVVMLQGIALAGFNVIDLASLHAELNIPVLVVARRCPDLPAIRAALLQRVPGGRRKWMLVERAGPMEPMGGVYVQRVGLSAPQAEALLARWAVNGRVPEPLRVAHLIAGGIARGESRGRV